LSCGLRSSSSHCSMASSQRGGRVRLSRLGTRLLPLPIGPSAPPSVGSCRTDARHPGWNVRFPWRSVEPAATAKTRGSHR
jgi:hypothetical protein